MADQKQRPSNEIGKYSVLMSLCSKEQARHLRRSIESMINQTVAPDQIVIVKDGPLTPELEEVLHEYVCACPGLFTVAVSERNLGLGPALELGLRQCRNEMVARMDADDVSLPTRCELQLREFHKDPSLSVLGGVISEFVGDEKNIVGKRVVPTEQAEICKFLETRCPFNHVSVMFRKSEVMKAGGYRKWPWNEDYYLWIRMFTAGCRFGNLRDSLVNVRVGEDMYKRRGGWEYFRSEAALQKYMLDQGVIGRRRYLMNLAIRFVVQLLLPVRVRAFVFRRFARSN